MIYKNTLEIRDIFINFFKNKGYTILDSSPLIPVNDNSILFTNAGMNQFKDFFLGNKDSSVDKIATIQRCLRAGGKHNDLEEVGYTNRHHTFFEMLGNFSFGKVTKEDIITDIWLILTEKDRFNLSKDRIFITVNKNDIETYNIWRKLIGLKKERLLYVCKNEETKYQEDNFWQMSEIGPCGPSTEIFYELNKECSIPTMFNNYCFTTEKYLEIWNIVFMQYYKSVIKRDGCKKEYILKKLPKLGIDTGIGLERLASILQGVSSNYNIDIFKDLINKISKYIHFTGEDRSSLNVIADHSRAIIFLINEGLLPSNEGRGYVLRRIIRRAIRHGRYLGVKKKFLYQLIEPCLEVLNSYYPSYIFLQQLIKEVVKEEESKFSITLDKGMQKLLLIIKRLPSNRLEGKIAKNLYETYGLPIYLTKEICKENNIIINDSKNSSDN